MSFMSFEKEPEELQDRREKALTEMEELEMPESIRTPGRTWTRLPEVDDISAGEVDPRVELQGDAEVFTGGEAVEQAGEKLLDAVKQDENRLNALHTVKMNSLVYVDAPGEAEVEVEYTGDSATFAHLVVDAGKSSEVTVREYFRGSGEVTSSIGEFYVGKNASVSYGSVQSGETALNYVARRAVVSRDGSMRWLNSVFGAELSKQQLETVLEGDSSSTEMLGAFYPVGEQHHDVSMRVRHRGENTSCEMNTRGVVDDRARSAYEGLQDVGQDAEETSSFQHENTLML
ncbi:MAG: SufD family Fe-S cluster assembly protein, partial [Candidatus Nanohaloarchaea archaeon]